MYIVCIKVTISKVDYVIKLHDIDSGATNQDQQSITSTTLCHTMSYNKAKGHM